MAWASAAMGALGIIPGIVQAAEKPRVARPSKPKRSPQERTALALSTGREDTILTRTGRQGLGTSGSLGGSPVPGIGGAVA